MEGEIKIRIRFNETDSMNYVYHGNYASFYHASRTELLRKLDLSDKVLFEQDILLPVIALDSKFKKPVFYDDEISVTSRLLSFSACKLNFEHKVLNSENELVNIGHSSVAFVNVQSRKPIKISEEMSNKLSTIVV